MSVEAPGLEGVVAARTRLSHVDGERGLLVIGGYPLEELAGRASFEDVVHLLWNGALPTREELSNLRESLGRPVPLHPATIALLRASADAGISTMDALRTCAATLELEPGDEPIATRLLRGIPAIVAAYHRLRAGLEPVPPEPGLGFSARYLHALRGALPTEREIDALDTYLVTVVDHGLNASTFTARVIVSTRSDYTSGLVGALGALKGPLHGGAPGPALDAVLEVGSPERAEAVLRAKLERGERLMGFGHRVYKVRDPRAEVLSAAAERLYGSAGDRALFDLARIVERTAIELLDEHKPGRRLRTNVEFYTALLLHGLGLPTELFTPTFAVGRTAGWLAHMMEQEREGRLIRPAARYEGPMDLRWRPSVGDPYRPTSGGRHGT